MDFQESKDNFFSQCFMEFYIKLLNVKERALAKQDISALEISRFHNELKDLLQIQAIRISTQSGAFIYDCYRELQYAMCGFADETMLFLDWVGKEWWSKHLLENSFFGTHNAGSQVFTNIDNFLQRRDLYKLSLGSVYIDLLSLGFVGKYNDNIAGNAKEIIGKYKHDLFFAVYQMSPDDILQKETLFNKTLDYNLHNPVVLENAGLKFWLKMLFGSIFTYLFLSHVMWYVIFLDISLATDAITRDLNQKKNSIIRAGAKK